MPGVAHTDSTIQQSTKVNHVRYVEQYIAGYDPVGGFPYFGFATWYSNALINGTVTSGSNNVFVNGKAVACVDSQTSENWTADPMPYPHYGGWIIEVTPGTSGSGTGTVSIGNPNNVFVNGKSVATIRSQVTTHLGSNTMIDIGSSNVFIGG